MFDYIRSNNVFKYLTQDAYKGNGSEISTSCFVTLLYMGETLTELHICGTAPDSMERSNRTFRIVTNSNFNSCNMTGLILSGQHLGHWLDMVYLPPGGIL